MKVRLALRVANSDGVPDGVECSADHRWPISCDWDHGPERAASFPDVPTMKESRGRDVGCQLGRFPGPGTHAGNESSEAGVRDHPDREASGRCSNDCGVAELDRSAIQRRNSPHHQGRCHDVDCSGKGGEIQIDE